MTLHVRIRDLWMSKMETTSTELKDKLFGVSNVQPCVEFLNKVGYRVAESVKTGQIEYSFVSFWDDLICHVLDFVGIGNNYRNLSQWTSTGPNPNDYQNIVDSLCIFRGAENAPGGDMESLRRVIREAFLDLW
ncbi:hypothetical protein THRCLA_22646 [Thraustotheca clavata]|uniref:Uncharacterized protein n=1 Tax=Thraustotheca clavata TaxID=74557 RepID=A0A1V9YV86_9STRA|nr:hypothetical protein THRCLA_22646 [Thraustotheca clavata]